MGIGADPRAIALIGAPVDETFVVVGDEHAPLRLRQLAHALSSRTGTIERDLMAALAIGIGGSASLMVPLSPSSNRSLNMAG